MIRVNLWRLALLLLLVLTGVVPGTEAAPAPSSATWHWLNPVPQGNNLQGVACVRRSSCYAVGNFGTILVTRDNGATWDPLASGMKRALTAVACPSPMACYTVGPYGTIVLTHDAGRTWSLHQQRGIYQLSHISCPAIRTCYALGSDMTHQCFVPGCSSHGQNIVLLVTRDGGSHWRRINAGKVDTLIDIACPGTNRCITVGDGGGTILLSADGGRTWTRRGSLAKDVSLQAITCADARICYAVGITAPGNGRNTGLFLTTTDSGRTWHKSTAIPPRSGVAEYGGIACPATGTCYVRGFRGTLLITHDGGRHWRSLKVATPEQPSEIACAGIQTCHVLGAASVILSTTNGGQTWHEYPRGSTQNLAAITCPTARKCRALAPSGLLVVTENGGQSWIARPSPLHSTQGFPLPGLVCPMAATCYVTGQKGTVYKTTDTGETWQTLSTPFAGTALPLAGVACPTASVCYTVGSGCLVANCYGPDSRVVVLGTMDGGHAWRVLYNQRSRDLAKVGDAILEAIACPSVYTCYVTGSPGLVITTRDSGRTWDDRHSPASSSNLDLSGIACPGEMVCYAVGTGCRGAGSGCMIGDFVGVVLTTRNGGRTWQRYESTRTVLTTGKLCGSVGVCPAGVSLQAIACASERACWTVGQDGTVLVTSDAGKTWRRETTPTDNYLFGIACPAVDACLAVGDGGTILAIGSTSLYTSQIRSHGVLLSVSLARRTYPQDALVRVTVRLVNVSRRAVQIGGTDAAVCYQQGPGIRVTGSAGQTVYPPAVNWLFASCGPPIIPRPLLPGRVIQARLLAVLRGNRLQAVASIGASPFEIRTPPLSVRLVSEPAPRAVVHPEFLSHIDVTPATSSQNGRFYYVESEACLAEHPGASGAVGSAAGIGRFQFTRPDLHGRYRFATICGSPSRWSFTGGWLNHRAVTVDYSAPGQATP